MRIRSITSFIFLAYFIPMNISAQELATPIQVKKADIATYTDIKPFIAAAYPNKTCENCQVQSFILTGSGIENNIPVSFTEYSSCGKLTEKQRALIDKYGEKGISFTLEKIMMIKFGVPGTPYNPNDKVSVSVPPILMTIKE